MRETPKLMPFTETAEWRKMMAGSVVTDNGRPYPEGALKKVFHGTKGNFTHVKTDFIKDEIGLHAGSLPVAESFLFAKDGQGGVTYEGKVIPLYYDIKRPLWMGDTMDWKFDSVSKLRSFAAAIARDLFSKENKKSSEGTIRRMSMNVVYVYAWSEEKILQSMEARYGTDGVDFARLFFEVNSHVKDVKTREELVRFFEKYGYDGIAYFNEAEARHVEGVEAGQDVSYIALYPRQARSALTGEQVWEEES